MLKKHCTVLFFILVFGFSVILFGNESAQIYFPGTLESFWVYEDQDGNEFTRYAIEGDEIAGVTYSGLSYDPELEDWVDFNRHVVPYLYHVGDEWVTFFVGEEVENAVKARFTKELETTSEYLQILMSSTFPPESNITFDLIYDVEVEAADHFYLFPIQTIPDEEWDATQINAKITLKPQLQRSPEDVIELGTVTVNMNILETGKVLGTETIDTAAGTFDDCLKIEYRTITEMTASPDGFLEGQPGETVTTLWFAPNVGIVKFHQEAEKIFLNTMPAMSEEEVAIIQNSDVDADEITAPSVKTFELKRYEIVPEVLPNDNSK